MKPWRHLSKALSVSSPGWASREIMANGSTIVREPRAVMVDGGWLACGAWLPWSRQTELIDRHRKIVRVVLPGDWP